MHISGVIYKHRRARGVHRVNFILFAVETPTHKDHNALGNVITFFYGSLGIAFIPIHPFSKKE